MNEAQKRFCDEYLIDLNATRAYKEAYPSCKEDSTARTNASRLLTNANIKGYIEQKQQEISERTQITQDKVINELAKIGFFNIKNIYNENGTLKQITKMEDEVSSVISSVKTLQRAGAMKIEVNPNGKDKDIPIEHIPEQTIEFKMNDKVKALELLGKHLGMFKEKIDLNANITNIKVELEDDAK